MPTTCTNIIPQIQHSPIENSRFIINNINPIIEIATFPFFVIFSTFDFLFRFSFYYYNIFQSDGDKGAH